MNYNEGDTIADDDVWLTRYEAARYTKFKYHTLATWDSKKRYDLKPSKVGRMIRYKRSHLDQFLEKYHGVTKIGGQASANA